MSSTDHGGGKRRSGIGGDHNACRQPSLHVCQFSRTGRRLLGSVRAGLPPVDPTKGRVFGSPPQTRTGSLRIPAGCLASLGCLPHLKINGCADAHTMRPIPPQTSSAVISSATKGIPAPANPRKTLDFLGQPFGLSATPSCLRADWNGRVPRGSDA